MTMDSPQLPQTSIPSLPQTEQSDQTRLSRRRLLKTLAATGSAVAVSHTLPHQWTKPLIETGVLPVHAQTSGPVTVSNLQKVFTGINDCTLSGAQTGSSNTLSFDYSDPAGGIVSGARVIFSSDLGTGASEIDPFTGGTVTGTGSSGTISINFCTQFGTNNAVTNTIRLRNASGQESGTFSITISRPAGANRSNGSSTEQLR